MSFKYVFPHPKRVDGTTFLEYRQKATEMALWINEQGWYQCELPVYSLSGFTFHFETEEQYTWFIMRWS